MRSHRVKAGGAADPDLLARALLTLGRTLLWATGPRASCDIEQQALDVLGPDGDPELRALAHADLARGSGELVTVGSIAQGNPLAVEHARRALALAEQLGRTDLRGYALMYQGGERWALGDAGGRADIDEAVGLLRSFPRTDLVVRACVSGSGAAYRAGRFEEAEGYVELGLDLARDTEFESGVYRLSLTRACVRASAGRWADAEAELQDLLSRPGEPGIMTPLARSVLARLLARQGRFADAEGILAPAERAASPDEVRVLGPVVLAATRAGLAVGGARRPGGAGQARPGAPGPRLEHRPARRAEPLPAAGRGGGRSGGGGARAVGLGPARRLAHGGLAVGGPGRALRAGDGAAQR